MAREHSALELPFVGRTTEFRQLKDRLGEVSARRHGACALVIGEPGIGKTRLVAEFVAWAQRQPGAPLVLTGRGVEGGADAYLPLLEAIAPLVAAGDVLSRALEKMLRQARVPGDAPARDLESVPDLVRTILGGRPSGATVLVFEDLHWADSPTVRLLAALVGTLSDLPVLIIGTYRPEHLVTDVPPPFAGMRDQIEFSEGVSVLLLRPLGTGELTTLLRSMGEIAPLPASFVPDLAAASAGIPLFVEETLRSLDETGLLQLRRGKWQPRPGLASLPLPESVRAVIDSRVARLRTGSRKLAELVAASRDGVRAEVASSAAGDGFASAAKELMTAQFLVRPGGRYRFAHQLLKEGVARSIPADRWPVLHRLLADSIERWEPDPGSLAHHRSRAGDPVRAFPSAVTAGDRAFELRESAGAIYYYTIALDATPALPDNAGRPEVPRILLKRGEARHHLGSYELAEADYEAGLKAAPDLVLEAQLQHGLAGIAHARTHFNEAIRLARDALRVLDAHGVWRAAFDCRRTIIWSLWRSGQHKDALQVAQVGRQVAEAHEDERRVALALADTANVLGDMGHYEEAIGQFRRAIVLLELMGKAEEIAQALNNLGFVHRTMGDWEVALQFFRQGVAKAKAGGFPLGVAYGLKNIAYAQAHLGRYSEADAACDEAFKIFQLLERREGLADCYRIYGVIHRFRREWASSESFFESALEFIRGAGIPSLTAEIHEDYGTMERDRGNRSRAKTHFEEALALYGRLGNDARQERIRTLLSGLEPAPGT